MNTATTNKHELSYFELKLKSYLHAHHPEKLRDAAFIKARSDEALSTYCNAIAQSNNHLEAEELASEVLFRDLGFSAIDLLTTILEDEFSKELPSQLPERLAPLLSCNKGILRVLSKYPTQDADFASNPQYEQLYTELTGAIAYIIEINALPIIGEE